LDSLLVLWFCSRLFIFNYLLRLFPCCAYHLVDFPFHLEDYLFLLELLLTLWIYIFA
jgi:hypothetical protein